ncbi:hypothetical protein CW702_01955 [Candidatus Bathyarchaeota archaeon]|nr:MAG: hypothetical protein CW702_01955 [Candidatus Bathyarchaeota archaeon]
MKVIHLRLAQKNEKHIVRSFTIENVLPCVTTPGYIRFVAKADNKLNDVIPSLVFKFPPGKVKYSFKTGTLTIRLFNRLITLFPDGKIGVTNTRDLDEAEEILQKIGNLINNGYRDYLQNGRPEKEEIERAQKLTWLDIYNCLPKTNCGECGFQACSAFAISVIHGRAKIRQCTPLIKRKDGIESLEMKVGKRLLKTLI